jgi:hypothetical protein
MREPAGLFQSRLIETLPMPTFTFKVLKYFVECISLLLLSHPKFSSNLLNQIGYLLLR